MDDPTDVTAITSVAVPHVERFRSEVTGQWVEIYCDCPLNVDHTYADWVARFGGRAAYGIE